MMTTGRPDHASACSLATFVCVFFLGPALLSGGLASVGPADGEAATQECSPLRPRGKAGGGLIATNLVFIAHQPRPVLIRQVRNRILRHLKRPCKRHLPVGGQLVT